MHNARETTCLLSSTVGREEKLARKKRFCAHNTAELQANYANCYTVTVVTCKVFTLDGPLLP